MEYCLLASHRNTIQGAFGRLVQLELLVGQGFLGTLERFLGSLDIDVVILLGRFPPANAN